MGVNILLNKRVIDYRDHKVILEDGTEIATRTFIWVSGVTGVTIVDRSWRTYSGLYDDSRT